MHEKSEPLPLLVGIEQACELLSIGRNHVYKLIAEEKLRPLKLGRRTLFKYGDLVSFADQAGAGAEEAAL